MSICEIIESNVHQFILPNEQDLVNITGKKKRSFLKIKARLF